MKKILFLFIFGVYSFSGYSQNLQADKVLKLGITAKASQLTLDDFYEWRDFFCFEGCSVSGFDPGHSYSVGISGSYALNDKFEIISGLEYAQKSYYEKGVDFVFPYRLRRNLQYLQIPALARYKFYSTKTRKVQAFVDLGFNALINLNQGKDEFTFEKTLTPVGFNAQTGIGLAVNFKSFTLAIGPQFSYAVSNLGGNGHEDGPDMNKLRPYEIGLGISVFH